MYMNNVLYNLCGKTTLKIKRENLSKMSLPELMSLMKAEQDGKVEIVITE